MRRQQAKKKRNQMANFNILLHTIYRVNLHQCYKINMGREIHVYVTYGYENNFKNMCVVTRVAIGFQAGYHHVKLNAENKNKLRRNTFM